MQTLDCEVNTTDKHFGFQITVPISFFFVGQGYKCMSGNVWNRPSGSFVVDMGSHQTLWSPLLPNVTWHSGTWSSSVIPLTDQTLHQILNLSPNWTLLPILTLLPISGGFHRILQRVRLANRGRLLLRTPGLVPFGTCICSNVETILSWTCHVYGPFEFRTSLGTSILYGGWFVPFRLFVISRRHNEGAITKRRKDESEKTKAKRRKDEITKAT